MIAGSSSKIFRCKFWLNIPPWRFGGNGEMGAVVQRGSQPSFVLASKAAWTLVISRQGPAKGPTQKPRRPICYLRVRVFSTQRCLSRARCVEAFVESGESPPPSGTKRLGSKPWSPFRPEEDSIRDGDVSKTYFWNMFFWQFAGKARGMVVRKLFRGGFDRGS